MSDRSFNMHRGLAHRTMQSDLCSHERLLEERLDTGSLIQWVWRGPKQLHLKQVTEIPLGQGPDFENHYYSTWSSVLHHFVWPENWLKEKFSFALGRTSGRPP